MAIKPCNKAALRALLSAFSAGLRANAHADLDELLLALRILQPRNAAVDLCDVRLRISRRDWIGALHILRTLEDQQRGTPLCAALQSWCLYALQDDDWRRYAQTVVLSGDRASTVLVGRFLKVNERADAVGMHDDDDVAARISQLLRLDRYQWARHVHASGMG
ncbi:HrpB1 family type III secretion system apparatus protein [Burkholderia sp. F1]|uniref:HrpB1 family type III secretion system apparatus protein n=1 Tax=Burkholderia sp. F1 TaxID=3366817 RepID=UPI003D7517EA